MHAADKSAPKEEPVNCDALAWHIRKKFLQFPTKCYLNGKSNLTVQYEFVPHRGITRNLESNCEKAGATGIARLPTLSLEIQKYQNALNRCISRAALPEANPVVSKLLTDLQQQKELMEQCVTSYNRRCEEDRKAAAARDAAWCRKEQEQQSLDKYIDKNGW